MAHATDIVGYTYKASVYCPSDIIAAVEASGDYEGWELAAGVVMSPEANLSEIAAAFGIERMDESTFDSDDFPKVIFSSQVEEPEYCETCGRDISE